MMFYSCFVYRTQCTYVKSNLKKLLTVYRTILINLLGSLNLGIEMLNLFSFEDYNKYSRNNLEKTN